jgi:CheY-like chemotaxis protein
MTQYPEWQPIVQAALNEFDETELQRKIFDAEDAIANRLRDIEHSNDHNVERVAIHAATRALLFVKEQKLRSPLSSTESTPQTGSSKTQSPTIRVIVADDNDVMRKSIKLLFEGDLGIQLVGEAATFIQTVQLIDELHPHVAIMDLHMPDEKEIPPTHFKLSLNGTRLLAMSIWTDEETKALAETFGAGKLLDKMNLASELIPAIKTCAIDGPATSV